MLVTQHGTFRTIGCRPCVRRLLGQQLLFTGLLGWWSLLGMLLTPVAVATNLYLLIRGGSFVEALDVLGEAGIDPELVTVGPDGLTGHERQMAAALAHVVGRIALGCGPDSVEWRLACRVVREATGRRLSDVTIDRWVTELGSETYTAQTPNPRLGWIRDAADRMVLLRAAVDVALADGRLTAAEIAALQAMCVQLGVPQQALDDLLNLRRTDTMHDEGLGWAYRALGLTVGATAVQVNTAYRRLVVENHPDLAADADKVAATQRTVELNRARDALMAA